MNRTDQILLTSAISLTMLGGVVGFFTDNIDVPSLFFGAAIGAMGASLLRTIWAMRKP